MGLLWELVDLAYANPTMAGLVAAAVVLVVMGWGIMSSSYRYR